MRKIEDFLITSEALSISFFVKGPPAPLPSRILASFSSNPKITPKLPGTL